MRQFFRALKEFKASCGSFPFSQVFLLLVNSFNGFERRAKLEIEDRK